MNCPTSASPAEVGEKILIPHSETWVYRPSFAHISNSHKKQCLGIFAGAVDYNEIHSGISASPKGGIAIRTDHVLV